MNPNRTYTSQPRSLTREDTLHLIQTAFSVGENRFASQVSLDWLTAFPGDLPIRYLYGLARLKEGHVKLARSVLEEVIQADPEYLEAVEASLDVEKLLKDSPVESHSVRLASRASHLTELSDLQEWVIALNGVAHQTPKRTYSDLSARWGSEVFAARSTFQDGTGEQRKNLASLTQSEQIIHALIPLKPDMPVVSVSHLRLLFLEALNNTLPYPALHRLAEHYRNQFPKSLLPQLIQAIAMMETSEPEKAVAALHSLAARDVTGQVIRRVLGNDHPYTKIWPEKLSKKLVVPVPAEVAAVFGWNRLEAGSIPVPNPDQQSMQALPQTPEQINDLRQGVFHQTSKTTAAPIPFKGAGTSLNYPVLPQALKQVQEELNKLGSQLKRADLIDVDARFPVYVILTTRQGLLTAYGSEQSSLIEQALENLAATINNNPKWKSAILYADEGQIHPSRNYPTTLKRVKPSDPWAIKLNLSDLDAILSKKGEMIGALLIIGGDEIVPFHRLSNPTEDLDSVVPSDNPYGTTDENYLIQDWPVGRLPSGSKDPTLLLASIAKLQKSYQDKIPAGYTGFSFSVLIALLLRWMKSLGKKENSLSGQSFSSFGYSAAAWRVASSAVFKLIGDASKLVLSPNYSTQSKKTARQPAQAIPVRLDQPQFAARVMVKKPAKQSISNLETTPEINLPAVTCAYFNLHGVAEAPQWYGEIDPTLPSASPEQPDHPVALQPGDVLNKVGGVPQLIFSEACYGAHILNKGIGDSLALSFLQSGCDTFVGSTCTSYGWTNTPLVAADQLAYLFWTNIRQGQYAGEALRQAKILLASKVSETFGVLGGEDQKTLISFVLYGDPLAQPIKSGMQPKTLLRSTRQFELPTACDHTMQNLSMEQVTPQLQQQVKKAVTQYLPGMQNAAISFLSDGAACQEACSGCKLKKASPFLYSNAAAKNPITGISPKPLKRSIVILSQKEKDSTRFARMTMDDKGDVIKLALSK